MDMVETVAAEIADIPGDPSTLEIARVAIEAYQKALWSPTFDFTNHRGMMPELRRHRANSLTAQIMQMVGKYICEHGENRGRRDASRDLVEAFYEAGAEIITDLDRTNAGLPPRGPYGMTAEDVRTLEALHTAAMLRRLPPVLLRTDGQHMPETKG